MGNLIETIGSIRARASQQISGGITEIVSWKTSIIIIEEITC